MCVEDTLYGILAVMLKIHIRYLHSTLINMVLYSIKT